MGYFIIFYPPDSQESDGGNAKFLLFSEGFQFLNVLPHSSAAVKRIFSDINCVKTMIVKTAETCRKLEPNKELIKAREDESVKRRYTDRLSKLKEEEKTTLYEVVDTENK